jgi:hypothetical protein
MGMRWMRRVGLLVLCVYAAAIAHQVLPHHPGHGNGDSCSLCLLLTSMVLLVLGAAFVLEQGVKTVVFPSRDLVFSRHVRQPFSLRGPPASSF